ncbi:helix-turn-helix domain-containing protein, partial [Candidatus Pelagibacter sp.]|nr:helix-turn-helix domain-containing protein [Candidatus Pelagibacter sp.]
DQLQLDVWKYHSELETHTVETHIYRLRKKILETFNDNKFIISQKNGYKIN